MYGGMYVFMYICILMSSQKKKAPEGYEVMKKNESSVCDAVVV